MEPAGSYNIVDQFTTAVTTAVYTLDQNQQHFKYRVRENLHSVKYNCVSSQNNNYVEPAGSYNIVDQLEQHTTPLLLSLFVFLLLLVVMVAVAVAVAGLSLHINVIKALLKYIDVAIQHNRNTARTFFWGRLCRRSTRLEPSHRPP